MNELVKASPATAMAMAKATLALDPETNTAALVGRLASLSLTVSVKHRLVFPTDQRTGEVTGWREIVDKAEVETTSETNIPACRDTLAAYTAPAGDRDIALWLTELSMVSVRRNETAEEAALAITAYVRRLKAYPGDIVRDTIQNWSGKWFPTWAELKDILDVRSAARNEIRTALNVHIAVNPKKKGDPPAVNIMTPVERHEWLLFEARRARRTDPDKAKELEAEASKLQDEIRTREREKWTGV